MTKAGGWIIHQTFVAGNNLASHWMYHWRHKVRIVGATCVVCRRDKFVWREEHRHGQGLLQRHRGECSLAS